jgi:molybdate transport system substrate-binding protein
VAAIKRFNIRAMLCCVAIAMVAACVTRHEPASAHIAVAANFTDAAKEIAQAFEQQSGNRAVLSFGSTGQLFAQITQGAPFEAFLAADEETPRKVVAGGFGLADSVFTYAVGKIVVFSTTLDLTNGEAVLREGKFQKLAIANPATAPYGVAATEALKSLGLDVKLAGKIVRGNNIAQTFQFAETGNAELGFVALSQAIGKNPKSMWLVPQSLYSPIRQDAVLLMKGVENEAARAFISFLKSPDAIKIIEKYGYAASD